MQTIRQRKEIAHWMNRAFRYQPAATHGDASAFRQRQIARGLKPKQEPERK